ncbi:MAG TPA: hypothetical protein VFK70_12735 [Vicinamibacteria bacterium]|nr:hypothetical protein [Vicinamibacteria bacterium]
MIRARGAAPLVVAVVAALIVYAAVRPPALVRFNAGEPSGDFLGEGWSESGRTDIDPEVGALDPSAAGFNRFRFRAASPRAQIVLPLSARDGGPVHLRVRALTRVRTAVGFHTPGRSADEVIVPKGPWADYEVDLPSSPDGGGLEAVLALRPLPLVRVPDEYMDRPVIFVSDVEASAAAGLFFSPGARLRLAAAVLSVFAFAWAVGAGGVVAAVAAMAAAAAVLVSARLVPLPLLLVVTRLVPFALGAGLLTRIALAPVASLPPRVRAALCALVAAGTLAHAALPFVPGFDPYDVEVHVRRARDLGGVPLEYGALLRYGSHLPTETQTFGTATAALGDRTLIPYSPLPYIFFYALHWAGIDLHWGMIALDAALLMAVAPWLWVVTARVWSPASAWIATALYTLDLPIWHHLGRAHVPASFGNALGTAALLYLALEAGRLDAPRRIAIGTAVFGVAVLGYSSLIVIFGLFGLALLVLFLADARALSAPAKKGTVAALVLGALLAGVLFYFHYVPGLLHGTGSLQQEPDLFKPRTFLFFHNESRQSMRVWAAGFLITLVAGLLAAPFALRRAWAPARPIFAAWLATWALVMVFKEPVFFPRPMRWAKEDQFVGPLLAILIGAALGTLPRPWMRWTAGALVVAVALWLQIGDFRTQMTGLMP